jgi:hypothetical protein
MVVGTRLRYATVQDPGTGAVIAALRHGPVADGGTALTPRPGRPAARPLPNQGDLHASTSDVVRKAIWRAAT